MSTISVTTEITPIECAVCGTLFGITSAFQRMRRQDGGDFYCPSGHANVYRKTELDKMRARAEEAEKRAREHQCKAMNAEAALAQKEKELKRHKKRSAAGVCPCCNRTVSQMARHMATKHPEYMKP